MNLGQKITLWPRPFCSRKSRSAARIFRAQHRPSGLSDSLHRSFYLIGAPRKLSPRGTCHGVVFTALCPGPPPYIPSRDAGHHSYYQPALGLVQSCLHRSFFWRHMKICWIAGKPWIGNRAAFKRWCACILVFATPLPLRTAAAGLYLVPISRETNRGICTLFLSRTSLRRHGGAPRTPSPHKPPKKQTKTRTFFLPAPTLPSHLGLARTPSRPPPRPNPPGQPGSLLRETRPRETPQPPSSSTP